MIFRITDHMLRVRHWEDQAAAHQRDHNKAGVTENVLKMKEELIIMERELEELKQMRRGE